MLRAALAFAALSLVVCLAACRVKAPVPDAHAVTAEGSLSNRFVAADKATSVAARLVVQARVLERSGRPPVNLALVVDTSGSMEGRAIEDARAASKALLGALTPNDRIAVVSFGSTTDVILPSTRLGDADLPKLRARIDAMKAVGTTDMSGGLRAGVGQVAEHLEQEGVNRVILLGDGNPNDEAPVKGIAADAGSRGISITVLGLGPDYNETLMGAVAQVTGGTFHYVGDSTKLAAFFGEEVVRLNRVYAKNAVVQLVPGPGVHVSKIVGQGGASGLTIPIGDITLGETREIVARLEAPPHRDGAAVELLDAVLRFDDVASGTTVEQRVFFGAHATASSDVLKSGHDDAVEHAVNKAEAAAKTLEAIDAARRGDVGKAQQRVKDAKASGYKLDDELVDALPSVAPAAAQPNPEQQLRGNEVVRKAHDDAMKVLQSH